MELNNNLIGIQGVLLNCLKQTGDFTRIHYKGGNERHILFVTTEIASFLSNKGLLDNNKFPPNCIKELNEIIFFLALNTEFKKQVPNLDEFSHLTNIIPQLSKCLLVNVCFALDLVGPYGFVIEKFPLEAAEELLDQAIECLKTGKPEEHLRNTFVILKSVVNKLSFIELSYKTDEMVEDIIRISNIILQNLTSITTDQANSMKASKIYQHMGFTLLELFELLLYVDENNKTLINFIVSALSTTCGIIRCVTLNVFCSWAEIDFDDQPLQSVIAGKAYLVMEKFQKNKMASELISMLSTIARKPKTIAERIMEADIPTMIRMVDEDGEHQKLWFRALLNTPVFSNPEIVDCIERWWRLCDESAMDRLLSLPLPTDSKKRQLIVKCASNLSVEGLTRILTIYFNREKFSWAEDINNQLILVFNQIREDMTEHECKNILLLALQNTRLFFEHFYATAFKRSPELIPIFNIVKNISSIDNIGLQILMDVLNDNVPTVQNIPNYIQLFKTMISCEYYSWNFICYNVLLPLINKYRNESNLEEFKCCLQILKQLKHCRCELLREVQLFEYIATCAAEYRCKSFLEFESIKEEITSSCIDYLLYKCTDLLKVEGKKESFPSIGSNIDDPWSNYYKNFFLSNENIDFMHWVLSNFDLLNYKEGEVDENFTRLLKLLPRCVSAEWKILLKEIIIKCGFAKTMTALSDITILLCDFTENQTKVEKEKNEKLLLALKFCLQNYGAFLISSPSSSDHQILAANNLCRVLKHIPDPLKPTEGMSLINTLPGEALQSLAQDKEFIGRIILINDKQLCKAFAQKVLASTK